MTKKIITGMLPLLLLASLFSFSQPVVKKQIGSGGVNGDFLFKLLLTKDGGFIAAGTSDSPAGGDKSGYRGSYDFWIVKYNSSGDILWDKVIGANESDELVDMHQTTDSGYIMLGPSWSGISGDKTENSRGLPYADYWVVKMDKNRNIQWNKTLGGSVTDIPTTIRQTLDGGYIIGGWSLSNISGDKTENSKGGSDLWIIKINAQGNIQWQKTIGGGGNDGTYLYGDDYSPVIVLPQSDGSYLIGSTSDSNISGDKTQNSKGSTDYWLVKLNSQGNVLWDKTIGGSSDEQLRTLNLTKDGGYIIGGISVSPISGDKTDTSRGYSDYWVVKLNSNAEIIWDKTIGGDYVDKLIALDETDDGYILGGHSSSARNTGEKTEGRRGIKAYSDYWVVKIDTSGNVQWNKTIGGSNDEHLYGIKEIKKNKYIMAGWSLSDASKDKTVPSKGGFDFWIVALTYKDTAGTQLITTTTLSLATQKNNKSVFNSYPNPVKDVLHIQNSSKATYMLTNQSGKILITKTINGKGEINVSHFSAGLYYLKNNETGVVQKIIITK